MVSVIVVTSNRAGLLLKCLHSIIAQTYQNIEIIVVDDGSTDNTEEIVISFKDKRILYIKKEKTGNVSMLRNAGIKLSKGEFIAFCDDDDMWMENKVEILLEYLKTERIVCSNANVIDSNDVILYDRITDFEGDRYIDLYQLLRDNRIQTSCVIADKNLLLEVGLFDEIYGNRSEDWCVWIKIAEKYKIKYVNKALVSYRIHDSNLSMRSIADKAELANRNIEILSPYLKHVDAKIVESAKYGLSLVCSKLVKLYYENGKTYEASKYCKKMISIYFNKFSVRFLKIMLFCLYLRFLNIFKRNNSHSNSYA